MAELIEHSGVVERIEGDAVLVRITSHSACGSCKARAACGLAETQEKIVEVHTPESGSYHPGEEVSVGVRRRAGAVAVVYAYVGALAVLLVVLMVSSLERRGERPGGAGRRGALLRGAGALPPQN